MQKTDGELLSRDEYLNQLIAFQDTEPVKVVTGVRRCGKSSLLALMRERLLGSGVIPEQIISMNFESMEFRDMDVRSFYQYVSQRVLSDRRMYFFFDELQRMDQWEDAVNSFRVDFNCDIYITGSNAYLLSSEYATYLAGRYVEIKMLPLSFQEFIVYHGFDIRETETLTGGRMKYVLNRQGVPVDMNELLELYLRFGGMPGLRDTSLVQDRVETMLDGIYNTIMVRDILSREKRRGQQRITDPVLLQKIFLYLADNVGNETSIHTIGKTLMKDKMLIEGKGPGNPALQTISAYISALMESYLFYQIRRYDIKGKEELKTQGKYYIVDPGLRSYLIGYRDYGHLIENVVYLELLRRRFKVHIGKVGNKEIDFIAEKMDQKIYYQVADDLDAEATIQRELSPLMDVRDNYEKVIIARNTSITAPVQGIKVVRLMDFLLQDDGHADTSSPGSFPPTWSLFPKLSP